MHLLAAGRELVLALRAALSPDMASGGEPQNDRSANPSGGVSHNDAASEGAHRLRRIDIQ